MPPLNPELVQALKEVLGERGVFENPDEIAPHVEDWRGNYKGYSALLLKPSSTNEVAAAVRICAQYNQPITPQGGNTGLVNGGIPYGEVILSLQRMNEIRDIDIHNNSMIVDAGCILENVHNAATNQNRFFPLSLGSQGTATIGGLISTNAGGVAVLRYGMMRDLILGLEIVTANGEVISGLRGLRKDNTGYDLRHIFCGAEGTLGIVTAAVLKLYPAPKTGTAWLTVQSAENAVELLSLVRELAGDCVTSFEIIPKGGVELTAREIDGVQDPLPSNASWRILLELSLPTEDLAASLLQTVLETALEKGLIEDGVIANSLAQSKALWHIRESLPLVKRGYLTSVNHDVSVPVSSIPVFLERTEAAMQEMVPDVEIFAFGHLGDGNIHYSVAEAINADNPRVKALSDEIMAKVHQIVTELGGSISAEHGIGLLKREELPDHKSPAELAMMKSIKRALDPQNIMNPGRILKLD